jgi:hypothetical protein
VTDHDSQITQIGKLAGDVLHSILAGCYKGRTQKQVFGGVTANSKFWRQQKPGTVGIGSTRGVNDFLGVAGQIADDKIELGYTDGECHGTQNKEMDYP